MMHQTFRGRTLDEARRLMVSALGQDAVIVATRKISKGGVLGLFADDEIEVAATPPEPRPRRKAAVAEPEPAREAHRPFSEGVYHAAAEPHAPSFDDLKDLSRELRSELRSELRAARLAATPRTPPAPPVPPELLGELATMRSMMDEMLVPARKGGRLSHLLESRGIEGPVAALLARRVDETGGDEGDDLKERLRDAVSLAVRVMPWPVTHEGRAMVALVGPAGVGKTTTAAKLAAHAIREGKTVTLVGADVFRVGAAQQLERYAELLGARFVLAASARELARVLARDSSDLIIVDTSGQSVPEPHAPEAFLQRTADGDGLEGRARYVLLCVPATLRANDARRVAARYGALAPTGVIVTKLDETDAPAGLLHAAYATRLPTAALCFGPQVPDAIAPATHGAILDHLIPLSSRKESGR